MHPAAAPIGAFAMLLAGATRQWAGTPDRGGI